MALKHTNSLRQRELIKGFISDVSFIHTPKEQKSRLVYEFRCQEWQCSALNYNSYIGMKNCTLKQRLTRHKYQGAIFSYFRTTHGKNPEVVQLLEYTNIIYFCNNPILLPITEALFIRKKMKKKKRIFRP